MALLYTHVTCALDAEGAFDAIPHEILFQKAIGVVPDHCWVVLVTWYKTITVQVKWRNQLSDHIKVGKGTRQGGLSSPFLFNLFYQDLIEELSKCIGGIKVNGGSYNVFGYADDLLLCSLTVTGLQRMINIANLYIKNHGLSFNPLKTECSIFGKCTFQPGPTWTLEDVPLCATDNIRYLGVNFSSAKPDIHCQNRISACKKAFYSLKGAGLCNIYNDIDTISYVHVYKAAIRPVLLYGLNCVNITKKEWREIEKCQAGILKSALHLHKFCRSTPVMRAINICPIKGMIELSTLDLAKSIFHNNSKARQFYSHLLNRYLCGDLQNVTLLARAHETCNKHDINFLKYICDEHYASNMKRKVKRIKPAVRKRWHQ